jgi:hypothetical protein
MSLFKKMVLASVAAISLSSAVSASTTLNVFIKDQNGNAVGDVTVAAIEFGMNGPTSNSQMDVTPNTGVAKGTVTLTLADNKNYMVMYSTHGYTPSLADQFNNPEYNPDKYVWADGGTRNSIFTVTSGLTGVGKLRLEFANATANTLLFGGVYNMKSQQQGGSGIVLTDGSGAGFLVVDNVPNAEANTYNIGLYDPQLNRGVGRNVGTALNNNVISYDTANKSDFDNSIPPARVDNNTAAASQTSSSGKLDGIVRSSGTANLWSPISRMGVSFRSCNNSMWTNVDENGRFQLSGLTIGATYYAEAMGGCTWSQSGPGKCYEPYRSPSILNNADLCANAPRGLNDFVYLSSITAQPVYQGGASNSENVRIILNEMAESTGAVRICVKSADGFPIPNANVNFNPDGSPWANPGSPCVDNNQANYTFNPGFSNKNFNTGPNGCVNASGLPTGNYMVNVWTPFSSGSSMQSSFNGNGDDFGGMNGGGIWTQAHCSGSGANDYRVYVETNPALGDNQMLHIYNSSGALVTDGSVALSSITYIVQTTTGSRAGEVKGVVKFPSVVDLSNDPIMITLYGQCKDNSGPCPAGNFTALSGSGANSYTYSIPVSTGFAYYMNVNSMGWGRVNRGGGDNTIHMESTGTVVVDMEFMRGGIVSGTMYKPDGTVFTPANNQYIWVDVNNNNGWSGAQLQKDGTFVITGVLPGLNRVNININGGDSSSTSFDYALPSPTPNVTVVAGSTVTMDINLVDAKYVGPTVNISKLPESTVIMNGWDQLVGFKLVPLTAGSVFNTGTIIKMLVGGDNDNERKFRYSPPTSAGENDKPCGEKWPGGFCAAALPSPGVYDFYLMRAGDFGKMDPNQVIADRPYPHFTMITSSKNVIVNAESTLTDVWASTQSKYQGISVNLTPATDMSARGNARLGGSVVAANFFRQADYDACGGDFDKFVQYLPVVALYNESNGAFNAAGIVLPPPSEIAKHDAEFNLNFMQGYAKFRDFLASLTGGLGYQIRGLEPNKCYTAVITTPNYPHYQKRVCLGGNGTSATLDINLDSAVGAGGTITGVVKSTPALSAIANAAVELTMEGSETRSVATGADGSYRFDGLSGGIAKVTVTMSSYAVTSAEVSVRGSNSYTQNIYLFNAPGSITGTVYSQKLPFAKVQSGAQIVAYDDTYNGLNQNMPLPLMKTRTGADGTYKLDGLVDGHIYKVFLKVPGKYTLSVSTPATAGLVSGVDFTMLAKPLDIEVFGKMNTERQVYEFTVLNPQDFKTGNVIWGESPLNPAAVSTVTMTTLSSGELHGEVDLSLLNPNKTYVLQGAAVSYSGKNVVRELLFGKRYKGNADQHIDDLMLGDDSDDGTGRKNNEAAADRTGDDPSSLVMPAGALITSTGSATVPTCSFKAEDKDNASVSTKTAAADTGATVASNLYTVTLSSVAQTDRPVELTLAYDKSITDTSGLTMKQYNNSTGKWEDASIVPATVNPVKGTITVKLKKLASVLARPGASPQAVFDGRQYTFRPQSAGSGTTAGTFAVMNYLGGALPNPNGKLKVFNYPNPFNLKSKAMTNNHGATMPATTNGTMIHVEVPAANEGACHIRIYTLAGELVKDISDTCTGGKYNYFAWDGHNSGGQEVANGVYYGVVDLAGKKPDPKNYTFKMVVIK